MPSGDETELPRPVEDEVDAIIDGDSTLRARRTDELCARHPRWAAQIRAHMARAEQLRQVGDSPLSRLTARADRRPDARLAETPGGVDGGDTRPSVHDEHETGGGGRYRVGSRIGKGGLGEVFRGRDLDLNRKVALKFLRREYQDHPDVLRRFVEEAQVGAQLQHPAIVPVYDLDASGERPFFAMKLVEGDNLAQILAARKNLHDGRPRLLGVFLQICQAVGYAHSRGVVHRDLKPANVMVGRFGEVQVMDWGLSKVVERGADSAAVESEGSEPESVVETERSRGGPSPWQTGTAGTPEYMPPEQACGEAERIGPAADVFGLGAILCEILTGAPPYTSEHADRRERLQDILHQAARGALEPAHQRLRASRADEDLVELAVECLHRVPVARPRDAGIVALRLAEHLAEVETRAEAARMRAAVARGRARLLRIVTVILLLLSAASVFFAVQARAAQDRAEQAETDVRAQKADTERALEQAEASAAAERKANAALQQEKTRALELAAGIEAQARELRDDKSKLAAANAELEQRARSESEALEANESLQSFVEASRYDSAFGAAKAPAVAAEVLSLLDKCPTAQRGFEWGYLRSRLGSAMARVALPAPPLAMVAASGQVLLGLEDGRLLRLDLDAFTTSEVTRVPGEVSALAASTIGVAVGLADGRVTWLPADGGPARTWRLHTKRVSGVAIAEQTGRLVSASWDRRVLVTSVEDGIVRASVRTDYSANAVALAADGETVFLADVAGTIARWRQGANTVEASNELHGWVLSMALSPDDSLLAASLRESGQTDSVLTLDPNTLATVRQVPLASAQQVRFAEQGPWLNATGTGSTQQIDVTSGAVVRTYPEPVGAYLSAESREYELVCLAGTDQVAVFAAYPPVPEERQVVMFPGRPRLVGPLQAGVLAATRKGFAILDRRGGGEPVALDADGTAPPRIVATSPDGSIVCGLGDGAETSAWILRGSPKWQRHGGAVRWLQDPCVTDDGVVVGVHESGGRPCLARFLADGSAHALATLDGVPTCLAVSPDGAYVVVADASGNVRMIPTDSTREIIGVQDRREQRAPATAVCVHPTGNRVALGFADGGVAIIDARTGAMLVVVAGGPRQVRKLAFTPDGSALFVDDGEDMRLWHADPVAAAQAERARRERWRLFERLASGRGPFTPADREYREFLPGAARDWNKSAWEVALRPSSAATYTDALTTSGRACVVAPDDPNFLNTYGALLVRLGRPRAAIVALERARALRRRPAWEDLAFLALAHHDLGQLDEARVLYETFLDSLPSPPTTVEEQQWRQQLHQELQARSW
ncbi:MAG: serine/threonine-protein kinase [Planctomycetota bacterium]